MPQSRDQSAVTGPIVHLSMSPLDYDARVKRTISALVREGFRATPLAPGSGLATKTMTFATKLQSALTFPTLSLAGNRGALAAYWSFEEHRSARAALMALTPSAVHAHDWEALPIAMSVGAASNIPVIYDSHEYASSMHSERRLWTLVMSNAIHLIEKALAPQCAAVITVSEGIADLLHSDLQLRQRPSVVRNLPEYDTPKERIGRGDRLLHYHGVLSRGRGIERLVAALEHLPPHFKLRLIGPERQPGFIAELTTQARAIGSAERLEVLHAVPPGDLVKSASDADFGFCVLDNISDHNRFALPNKIFEYIMAGLFTIVSDGREMADVIRSNSAGAVLGDTSPLAIASAIREVSDEQLDTVRRSNLDLAKRLNWSREAQKLISLYRRIGL